MVLGDAWRISSLQLHVNQLNGSAQSTDACRLQMLDPLEGHLDLTEFWIMSACTGF